MTDTSKRPETTDRFVEGYLSACQNLVAWGELHLAETMILESGETVETLLRAQRESGFKSRQICPIIRRAAREAIGAGG